MTDRTITVELTEDEGRQLRDAAHFAVSHPDFAASRMRAPLVIGADKIWAELSATHPDVQVEEEADRE